MNNISQYLEFLKKQVDKYTSVIEDQLGSFDHRFVFGTIRKTPYDEDVPHTSFPDGFHLNGNCTVDIHISSYPWDRCSPDQGSWQVAHECVHLLDPGKRGSATFLEEGLATWFQNNHLFHTKLVRGYIDRNTLSKKYREAEELVKQCMPGLVSVVKQIRSSGVRISEINPEMLTTQLPEVQRQTIERLCTPFE